MSSGTCEKSADTYAKKVMVSITDRILVLLEQYLDVIGQRSRVILVPHRHQRSIITQYQASLVPEMFRGFTYRFAPQGRSWSIEAEWEYFDPEDEGEMVPDVLGNTGRECIVRMRERCHAEVVRQHRAWQEYNAEEVSRDVVVASGQIDDTARLVSGCTDHCDIM